MTLVIWWLGLTFFALISRAFTAISALTCDHGWVAHNRSCYRLFFNRVNWLEAKEACRDTGGHLVRIESLEENNFLNTTEPFKNEHFWIGLNHINQRKSYVWEFLSNYQVNFTSWALGHPAPTQNIGFCVEMYRGLWRGNFCDRQQIYYLCEKEEGKNVCPDGWIPYNDTCYQFNMGSEQKMGWLEAKAACKSISNFASLVKIASQDEQEFITRRLQDFGIKDIWIGLNDLKFEAVFRWSSDDTVLTSIDYQIWGNSKPSENNENNDCVMILGVRQDGAWTVENCSLRRNFICTRHRDMPYCNVPLGMENKNILDTQITASSSLSISYGPQRARLRHNSYWCPSTPDQKEYLQVDLLSLYNVTKIVTQGNVTAYTLKISKDGKGYMDIGSTDRYNSRILMVPDTEGIVNLKSVAARFLRIYPSKWKSHPCVSVEFMGCPAQVPSSTECLGKNWEKGPGNLCFQINMNEMMWSDARSVCLDQGGDLLSIRDKAEHKLITNRLKAKRTSYIGNFWISLNDRDYQSSFYWSNNDANSFTSWGSGQPNSFQYREKANYIACVAMNYKGIWEDTVCNIESPFICMKRADKVILPKDVTKTSPTGVWISSAKYFWPLSAVENNMVLGTRLGKVNGNVTITSGVKKKPSSALQFSSQGSYIDFGKFEKECIISPDYCSNGLTLSFMASFDKSAVSWSKRVNIIDSVVDEADYNGLGVFIQNKQLWFVVSKTFKYIKTKVPITGDNTWRHYVMRWNGSDIHISVNAQATSTKSVQGSGKDNPASNFVIGIKAASVVTSGKVNLALVAFWDRLISNDDISLIYKTEYGSCPVGWHEYGMSCYQFNTDKKDFNSATTQCQRFGGELLIVNSNVEQAFITDQLRDNSFIGITVEAKHKRKRILKESNMDIIKYSNWNTGQPDTWRHGLCTKVLTGGFWEKSSCVEQSAYICEKPKELEVKDGNTTNTTRFVYTCQYTRMKLGCPTGLVIRINTAFWGRRERRRCSFTSIKDCGLKEIGNTTSALKRKCDHVQTCDLHASENEPYLTNPCPGISKYLEVSYSCVKHSGIDKCRPGWKFFGDACYRLIDTQKTWNYSRMHCQNSGSDLLSISSNFEQSFATSLMERTWYSNVWIGLNDLKTKGVYEWSDGSSVSLTNWYVGQPDERGTEKSCVYMSLTRGKRGLMYWSDQNCTNKFAFVCKYYLHPRQTPTTPAIHSGWCSSYGWSTSKNLAYCYMFSHKKSEWEYAEQHCMFFGGRIASILSKEENEFVRKLTSTNIWIGMETKGVFRGHSWSDGQPVVYTNWDINQPDSYNGVEACVEMDPRTGRWSDAKCTIRKKVVCKKPKTIQPTKVTTKVYPTPGSPLCKNGWTLFQGMCYITGSYKTIDIRTWHEAEKYCQTFNNGHLASINSKEEQNFIEHLIKNIHNRYYRYWIGLTDIHIESSYRWSDDSVFNFANWDRYEPNDYERQEDCISVGKNGMWKDKPCQFQYSYICESYPESYTPPPTLKPTRPPADGFCAPGWIANGVHCYKFYTRPSEYKTWYDARDFCHQGRTSGGRGELVSILDVFEQAFLVAHLRGVKRPVWIGFNNRHLERSSQYLWVDNQPSTYVNWNVGQPPAYSFSKCVETVQTHWAAGRWNAVDCWKLNGYICKTAASNKPMKKPTNKPPKSNKCPKGYKTLKDSCYKFVKSRKTFDEARKACQKESADLMAVDTHYTQAYLVYLLERYIGNVWIGLVHEPYSSFKFVDHRAIEYTYWGVGQPNRKVNERSCTQANVTRSDVGVWDDVDCDTTNPFVCEIYKGEPHVTIPLDAHCPEGWKKHHKYCYKHFDNGKKWIKAQFHCARVGANLVSIHNKKDEEFLMYYYRNWNLDFIWTGLNGQLIENIYIWSDKSQLSYINWDRKQPKNDYGISNCVKMNTKTGRWETSSCDAYLQYMCKRRLECTSVIHLDTSMVTVTDSFNSTSFGADKAILNDENAFETAWCTNNTSGTAKIMVELGQLVRVTAISFQGREYWDDKTFDNYELSYIKSFRIDYKRNGHWRPYHTDNYHTTILGHQSNGGTNLDTRTFKHPIALDGLSVTPVTWYSNIGLICMKIRLHGCTYVCQRHLLSDFPDKIKDDLLTASSVKYATNGPKEIAMEGHSWCAKINDKKQWIQFNFDKVNIVSKITTAGNKKDSYVKKYRIQFRIDGNTWIDYKQNNVTRIFLGNNDPHHGMTHLVNRIQASNVRIIPISWKKNICMRISLYGCKADCDQPLLARPNGDSSFKYTSSDKNSHPEFALFNTGKAWCTNKTQRHSQYLEIDLGEPYRITKIATRPSKLSYEKGGRIPTFTLKYKSEISWIDYAIRGKAKVLSAVNQTSSSDPVFHVLTDYYRDKNGLLANGVRIYPREFNGLTMCMTVELYGCISAGVETTSKAPTTGKRILEHPVYVSIRFTSIEWNEKMKDVQSEEYIITSKRIETALQIVYSEDKALHNVLILKLSKGSVVAKILLLFDTAIAGGDNATLLLEIAVRSGKVGSLEVDKNSFRKLTDGNIENNDETEEHSDDLSSGAVAGLVIGILVVLALIIGAFIYFLLKRRASSKMYDEPISYSKAKLDEDEL